MSALPSFSYILPVHNDADVLEAVVDTLVARLEGFPRSEVLLVENGSRDRSPEVVAALEGERRGVRIRAFSLPAAGIGHALHRGMLEAFREGDPPEDAWVVLTASDLPFGFSDLDAFLSLRREDIDVAIGSKAHPQSQVPSGLKRRAASVAFRAARRLVLGMRTGDSQGTFFLRAPLARRMAEAIRARDFFFTTELTALLEREGVRIVELPVVYRGEIRPSTVRLGRDGTRMLAQLLLLRFRS